MRNVGVPRVSMPPGRKFQALWTLLHLGAVGLAVYVVMTDLRRISRIAPRAAGAAILFTASGLHLISAVYHWQKAV